MRVRVAYRNPLNGDLADMVRIVQQAAASNTDGVIGTIADYDVLCGPVTDAVGKGIPVIAINSSPGFVVEGGIEIVVKIHRIIHRVTATFRRGFLSKRTVLCTNSMFSTE